MISTANPVLPHWEQLKNYCKAMAVLDAILSPEWQYRYYSYNSDWSEDEEFFEMRNGEGAQLLMLFLKDGAVINGFSVEEDAADKDLLLPLLPEQFHEFIYGEPVHSAGTSFCLWQSNGEESWQTPQPAATLKLSAELLSPFDGAPLTYKQWADSYFESNGLPAGIPLEAVKQIFAHQRLDKDMVLAISPNFTDWEQLKEDLEEISYNYHL